MRSIVVVCDTIETLWDVAIHWQETQQRQMRRQARIQGQGLDLAVMYIRRARLRCRVHDIKVMVRRGCLASNSTWLQSEALAEARALTSERD